VTRRDEILEVAEALLEAEGPDALTMRRLATELGMQAPSLYKHVRGKDDIEGGLQERALRSMGQALGAAGSHVPALAQAYRSWAHAHPRLYELATRRPLRRDELADGVEAAAAAPIVAAVGGDEHAARALWGLAHGLVDLELAGRFPPGADLDETWRTALTVFSTSA
jgi:AcrR family transcriptional regulator